MSVKNRKPRAKRDARIMYPKHAQLVSINQFSHITINSDICIRANANHSKPIKTIPINSYICIQANANNSEPIRKTFCISFDEKR